LPPGERMLGGLAAGDCFGNGEGGGLDGSSVELIDCADTHSFEVTGTREAGPDVAYTDARSFADDVCRAVFAAYVGIASDGSELGSYWFTSNADAWEAGERRATCFVGQEGRQLVGSVLGAQR